MAKQIADCERCRQAISVSEAETGFKDALSASLVLIIPALDTVCLSQQDQLRHNELSYLEQVSVLKCTSCDKSVALLFNGAYCVLEKLLHDETKEDGWHKVESISDRLVLYILSQIIYREYEVPDEDELAVEYALPPQTDICKVLWIKNSAVGFYSAKPRGSLDLETMEWYSMAVLDTLFIRKPCRRNGYALSSLKDLLLEFPDQNVGLSFPISQSMKKVASKYLNLHPNDRMKLWEITGCGSEGNCQNLWYLFKRHPKTKPEA
ncbi:unnamed protein product [Orchesella dallaii]|uniref:Uncharacterized protein n=1 Tax=Orchesella dallaii TaxID=48710 RepID=A0ABP1PJA8_9HEXA